MGGFVKFPTHAWITNLSYELYNPEGNPRIVTYNGGDSRWYSQAVSNRYRGSCTIAPNLEAEALDNSQDTTIVGFINKMRDDLTNYTAMPWSISGDGTPVPELPTYDYSPGSDGLRNSGTLWRDVHRITQIPDADGAIRLSAFPAGFRSGIWVNILNEDPDSAGTATSVHCLAQLHITCLLYTFPSPRD